MSGQLQDTKDPHQLEDCENAVKPAHPSHCPLFSLVGQVANVTKDLQRHLEKVWNNSHHVHKVKSTFKKHFDVRCGDKTNQIFRGEKDNGNYLDPLRMCSAVNTIFLKFLHGVESHCNNGEKHQKAGKNTKRLCHSGRIGILHNIPKSLPDIPKHHVFETLLIVFYLNLSPQFHLHFQVVLHLINLLLEHRPAAELSVLQAHPPVLHLLLKVDGAHFLYNPQHAAFVEMEDVMEDVGVPVEEELIRAYRVVIAQLEEFCSVSAEG